VNTNRWRFPGSCAAGFFAAASASAIMALFPAFASGETTHALPVESARPAAAFVDSIGVQTHISYIDTPYAQWDQVRKELVRLGIHHVRDALPMSSTFVANHRQLAEAGIHCTCGVRVDDARSEEGIVRAVRTAEDVDALEAPNECDAGTNCGGGGARGIARATSLLPLLAGAAHQLNVPLVGPSFTTAEAYASAGPISQWVNFNNLHVYFGGREPETEGWGGGDRQGHRYGSLDWWVDQSKVNAPDRPTFITETGYEAFDAPPRPGTIPLDIEATYVLRTLLLAWNRGISRTFIYELLDEFPGSGYGLLRHDLSEKPAYTALRNLILVLGNSTAGYSSHPLPLNLLGGDSSLCHTLLQEADGSYSLILWLEKTGYDTVSQRRIQVPSESIRIQLASGLGVDGVVLFKEDGSASRRVVPAIPSTLTVNVNDRLSVVHIVSHAKASLISHGSRRNQRLSS